MAQLHPETKGITNDGNTLWQIAKEDVIIERKDGRNTGRICLVVRTGKEEVSKRTFMEKAIIASHTVSESFKDPSFGPGFSWSQAPVEVQLGSQPIPLKIGFAAGPKISRPALVTKAFSASSNYDNQETFDFSEELLTKKLNIPVHSLLDQVRDNLNKRLRAGIVRDWTRGSSPPKFNKRWLPYASHGAEGPCFHQFPSVRDGTIT
eukprot:SAG25_NODE_303_length_10153_cov_13.304356_5_plen_206_part_00